MRLFMLKGQKTAVFGAKLIVNGVRKFWMYFYMKATPRTMGPLPHRLASSSGELFLTQYVGIYMAKLTKWTGYLLNVQAVTTGAVTLCVRNCALETTSNVPYGMHTHNLNDLDCGHKPRLPLLPLLPLVCM